MSQKLTRFSTVQRARARDKEWRSIAMQINLTPANFYWHGILLFHMRAYNSLSGISHGKLGNHHYFLSWREPWHKFEDWDWFNGRNFCRERCMDLISFDDPTEFKMFEEVMIAGK